MNALLQQMMLMAQAAAPPITFVDAGTNMFSALPLSISVHPDAREGDVVLASLNFFTDARSSGTPTDWVEVVPFSIVAHNISGVVVATAALFAHQLSSADISAGSVTLSFATNPTTWPTCVPTFWRGMAPDPLDVSGWTQVDTSGTGPFTLTPDAIVPTITSGLRLFFGAIYTSGGGTKSFDQFAFGFDVAGSFVGGYDDQIVAYGPLGTDAVSCVYEYTGGVSGWGATLVSLKPASPSIIVYATFPSSPHVGDAVSFDVTATLANGATGTLTITVDQLPAGLTLGSTSMVDATHYKATVSGTLTTEQDITSTFGATGGSVAATALVHDFSVIAASSTPVLVNQASTGDSAASKSLTLTFGFTPTEGNTLLLAVREYVSGDATTPTGWTLIREQLPSGSSRPIAYYQKTSDGTETSVTISFSQSQPHAIAVQEWQGSVTFGTSCGKYIASGITNPQVCGPTDAPPSATAVPSMFLFFSSTSTNRVYWPAGWTGTSSALFNAHNSCEIGSANTSPNAAVSPSISFDAAPGGFMYWTNIWVDT